MFQWIWTIGSELEQKLFCAGNCTVLVAHNMQQAVALCVYLEGMCRIELAIRATGQTTDAPLLTSKEARKRADWNGPVEQRYVGSRDVRISQPHRRRATLELDSLGGIEKAATCRATARSRQFIQTWGTRWVHQN
jgi:hypothetical protein